MEVYIRKIIKNGRGSYYINIPIDLLRELKWRERQKLEVKLSGSKMIVKDWSRKRK